MHRPFPKAVILIVGIGFFLYITSSHLQLPTFQQPHISFPNTLSSPLQQARTVERISQLDSGQYDSPAEYNTWAYSACSAAAMTEVMNAYGHQYRVTDILRVEAQLGEITPNLDCWRKLASSEPSHNLVSKRPGAITSRLTRSSILPIMGTL